jgi:hypothetical protein
VEAITRNHETVKTITLNHETIEEPRKQLNKTIN